MRSLVACLVVGVLVLAGGVAPAAGAAPRGKRVSAKSGVLEERLRRAERVAALLPARALPPLVKPPVPVDRDNLLVEGSEWYLRPSKASVRMGSVAVDFTNFGEDPHDLWVRDASGTSRDIVGLTGPEGQTRSGQVALAPGDYTLYCSLPGHEALGMSAPLQVR